MKKYTFLLLVLILLFATSVKGDFESGLVDDTAYNATTWNSKTSVAPSMNSVRDILETIGSTARQASDTALTTLASKLFAASALTGGAAGALDAIAVAGIADGDIALVGTTDGNFYSYTYESSSATAESSPTVIKPDDNSGNGRWILQYHAVSGAVQIQNFNLSIQAGDGTYSGLTINYTAGETLAFGQPVYVKSDGKVWKADADAAATMPAVGLIVVGGNANATVTILVHGYITETDWNWTIGNTIYVADGDAGAITATLADISDENDVVQIIGIAVHADSIFVNPSLATVVLAAP